MTCREKGSYHGPEWECLHCSDFRPKPGFFAFREARPKPTQTINVLVVQQLTVLEKPSFLEWVEDLFR